MTTVQIIILVLVLLVIAVLVAGVVATMRRRALRDRFGPEYDRTVADAPSKREAEAELSARRKRREELDIQPLSQSARDRYASRWKDTQARFVDDPEEAVGEADALIQQVMRERGYPVEDFDQRTADVSVDHPDVVNNYRAAHGISVANERGNATTDDLRQAMVHYRALFVELLEEREPETTEATR